MVGYPWHCPHKVDGTWRAATVCPHPPTAVVRVTKSEMSRSNTYGCILRLKPYFLSLIRLCG